MKIALAQINPVVGDIRGNSRKIIRLIKKTNAELIVFPELSITGYSPGDLALRKDFVKANIDALHEISGNVQKSAVIGFINNENEKTLNSAAFIQNYKIELVCNKIFLPSYSIFDEKRWFSEGKNPSSFILNGIKFGLSICEDIWFPDVAKAHKKNNADIILNISASPYSSSKIMQIENALRQRFGETGLPIIYVNQAGSHDGIVYCGHSMYFDNGRVMSCAKDFDEDVLIVDIKSR